MLQKEVLDQEAKAAIIFIAREMSPVDQNRKRNMLMYLIDIIYDSIRRNLTH